MARPCLIVADREHSGTLSMRKLVIESAKFNVLTAYSGAEAIEVFDRFPAVNGVILNAITRDMPCSQVIAVFRERAPNSPSSSFKVPAVPNAPVLTTTSTPSIPSNSLSFCARYFLAPLTSSSSATTPSKPKGDRPILSSQLFPNVVGEYRTCVRMPEPEGLT